MSELINNVAFLVFNFLMALHHSHLISENKKVKHGWWSAIYLLLMIPFGFLFNWWYPVMGVFFRGWFFSPCLNLLRGKGLTYWSLTSTSIIDKIERAVFHEFWIARVCYFALWITTIIIEA